MNNEPKERGAPVPGLRVLLRIAVALLTGVAVYLIAVATHLETPWRLMLSTFIGGGLLVVPCLAGLNGRVVGVRAQKTRRPVGLASKLEELACVGHWAR